MKRRGFGLITAIVLLVLISTVAMMILSITATSSKKATDDYLRIQAEMLSRSATEFAIMRVQGFNKSTNNNCLENLDITATPFDINVTINYLFSSSDAAIYTGCNNKYDSTISDTDLNGTVIMDVVVTEQMPLDQATWNKEPIRIHKRTIQKP